MRGALIYIGIGVEKKRWRKNLEQLNQLWASLTRTEIIGLHATHITSFYIHVTHITCNYTFSCNASSPTTNRKEEERRQKRREQFWRALYLTMQSQMIIGLGVPVPCTAAFTLITMVLRLLITLDSLWWIVRYHLKTWCDQTFLVQVVVNSPL